MCSGSILQCFGSDYTLCNVLFQILHTVQCFFGPHSDISYLNIVQCFLVFTVIFNFFDTVQCFVAD